jgi:hypothetical protein
MEGRQNGAEKATLSPSQPCPPKIKFPLNDTKAAVFQPMVFQEVLLSR